MIKSELCLLCECDGCGAYLSSYNGGIFYRSEERLREIFQRRNWVMDITDTNARSLCSDCAAKLIMKT